jgi:primary-amine oxidase
MGANMSILKNLALPLTVVCIIAFAWVLNQSISGQQKTAAAIELSPWDGLHDFEYQQAAALILAAHQGDVMFARISLRQPDKALALAWQEGDNVQRDAEISFLVNGAPRLAYVDLSADKIISDRPMRGGHPMYSSQGELEPLIMKLMENADLLAALEKRGVSAGQGLCLPRTIGRNFADKVDVVNHRIVRLDCFNIAGDGVLGLLPSSNVYARPIEGLAILYDLTAGKIIEITDTRADNPPPHDLPSDDFNAASLKTRAALRPVASTRPQGANYKMRGSHIDWQGWQFHLRFDARQGTVLNRIGHQGADRLRSVAYEIAMSEMFVPYHDNDPNWFYRAYFDMGEYGFGNMATQLQQADCPSHADYLNVTLHLADGTPFEAADRICIFEHDPGHPAWRHDEPLLAGIPGIETHQSRRATELVVRMVATIGNYDYFQDYVFTQDGRLRIRLISTGLDAAKAVLSENLASPTAEADTQTGTLIAPHRLGVNHDHFFSYRIDFDIDGAANDFTRMRLVAPPQPKDAPRQGIWQVRPEKIADEKTAQTAMNAERPAALLFSSGSAKNAMGYPTGYQLIMPNIKPLVTPMDEAFKRAYWVNRNLWVTRYKREEIFASGLPTNQSASWLGLPEYIADNENIEGTDIVAWATMGFHHVPMAEDWPVMPSKVDEIILKPRNFFDRNPAIDLPN